MGLIAKDSGGSFTLAPEGTHIAVCVSVIDLGLQFNKAFGKTQPKVHIAWELAGETTEDGKPILVSNRYTSSTNEKANLRLHLESWRGKAFSEAEVEAFDIRAILGKACMLNIVHEKGGEKTYANIKAVMALPKGTQPPKPVTQPVAFDIDSWDNAIFESLPDFLKKAINERVKPGTETAADKAPPEAYTDITDKDIPF